MIRVPGMPGVAFGQQADGDGRGDAAARDRTARSLDIPNDWAIVDQVHGGDVVVATEPGHLGPADALVTEIPGLPLAIGTADCVPVAMATDRQVAIAHAGWRGVVNNVVRNTIGTLEGAPETVAIGPHIRSCCFEVGDEVIEQLGGFQTTTTWGTTSADLSAAVQSQLPESTQVIDVQRCTMCGDDFASFRRDRTAVRQVSLVWR